MIDGIISSIIASIIIALASLISIKKYKRHLTILFGKILGSEIEYVYKNDNDAKDDIVKHTKHSKTVKIFSMRGFRMLNEDVPLSFLLKDNHCVKEVRVLLADPGSRSAEKRAEEYICIDSAYNKERYIRDIRFSIDQLGENLNNNSKLKLRLHQEPAFARLLITDDFLFLSFFLRDKNADNSPVFRVNRSSPLYESFCRYHDWVWKNESTEYQKSSQVTV